MRCHIVNGLNPGVSGEMYMWSCERGDHDSLPSSLVINRQKVRRALSSF